MNPNRATEALDLPYQPAFLKGLTQPLPGIRVIRDLDLACDLAFSQHVPAGYRIWLDIHQDWRGSLRAHPQYDEAERFANEYLETAELARSRDVIAYRKKRVRKQATPWETFVFSEARDDACSVLTSVAINRYLDGYVSDRFFETVFDICKLGGWPCGMTAGGEYVAFDPAALA